MTRQTSTSWVQRTRGITGAVRLAAGFAGMAGIVVVGFVGGSVPAAAIDHGRMGEIFPIIETDMLTVIAARLHTLEATGSIAQLQARMRDTAIASVRLPALVAGLSPAQGRREWLFDPSFVLQQDMIGANGERIAAKGTRVNPLDLVPLPTKLVFVDGRRTAELEWATRRWKPNEANVIFVAGSPFDAMKPFQRRFWFDQRGALVARFGIRHTPAVVTSADRHLQIAEVPVPDRPIVRKTGS